LKRGVFAKKHIGVGQKIFSKNVFFAMPLLDKKLDTSKFFDTMVANRNYKAGEALDIELALQKNTTVREDIIKSVILEIRGMINNARIKLNPESEVELSHHYGIERLREYGAVIVNCINNDEYCKKYVIQLPSQSHPYHYHKKKKETFQVLYGDLELEIDGNVFNLKPGDIMDVNRGKWHKFSTDDGVIFEEVSTTSYSDDSFYEDERIALLPREKRKTIVELKN
jgi:N-acetylneuraminate synthase